MILCPSLTGEAAFGGGKLWQWTRNGFERTVTIFEIPDGNLWSHGWLLALS
jgi:hypothetical protein